MTTGQETPQEKTPILDSVGLKNVSDVVRTSMTSIQQVLAQELDRIGTMSNMGVADMIQIQNDMANYTVAGQTLSAIMKDISDTLKTVANHIG